MTTIGNARKNAIDFLKKRSASETCILDVDVIFSCLLKKEKSFLISHRDDTLSFFNAQKLKRAIKKRAKGIPVSYITKHKEFFALDFFVNKNVLIPKPDTELLVEVARNFFKKNFLCENEIAILDLCTGSACVGISLAKEILHLFPEKKIDLTLSDISRSALLVAKKNVKRLLKNFINEKKIRVQFIPSDLFTKLNGMQFHLIVSNPPYIPTNEARELLRDGRSEPILALDGKSNDGFAILQKIISSAREHLLAGGALALETGEYNAKQTQDALYENNFENVKLFFDLANKPRVSFGIRN